MFKLKYIISGFLILFLAISHAQSDVVTIKDLSNKAQKQFKKGKKAAAEGDTKEAEKQYLKVLEKYPDMQEALLNLGGLFLQHKNYEKSESYFLEALKLSPETYPLIQYSLGILKKETKSYGESASYFDTYLSIEKKDKKRIKRAEVFRDNMQYAANAILHPVDFDPIKLPTEVNGIFSEYTPVLRGDGKELIFTRRSRGQEDFYMSEIDEEGNYTLASPLDILNTPGNEGAHTISADGNYMVFTACGRRTGLGLCDLYYSKREDGEWTDPINMGKRVNSAASDSEPSLTADGTGLYFSSDRKGSLGGNDIWYTKRRQDGKWHIPVNLGKTINTVKNEESPFIHHDGVSLYFRSNGLPGMGDYDIYKSTWNKEWSEPMNIGYPINTEGSEGALTISLDGEWAFYASDRDDIDSKLKDLDIYKFAVPPSIRPKLVTFVQGQIRNKTTGSGLQATVSIQDLEGGEAVKQILSNANGNYFVSLPVGKSYSFTVEEEGFLFHSARFELEDIYSNIDPFQLDIELQAIILETDAEQSGIPISEKPIVLNNIFFESGSDKLIATSNVEIDRLVKLLLDYPNSEMVIIGHTDNVGNEDSNLTLSKARAEAVLTAINTKGIDENRLSSVGKGESEPIAENSDKAGRKQNRRTEFIFIRK